MIQKSNVIYILFFIGLLSFLSCDSFRVYDNNISLKDNSWHKDSVIAFNANINDTLGAYNVLINIRHGLEYEWQNLILFVKVKSPAGDVLVDTLNYDLCNNKGEWHGDKSVGLYSMQLTLRKNIKFPYSGIYSFEIQQGMRQDKLKSLYSIGLRIERFQSRGQK